MKEIEKLKKELSDLDERLNIHKLSETEICVIYMLNKKKELEIQILDYINGQDSLNGNLSPFSKFEHYLIMVGVRSSEYTYTEKQLFENIEYFRKCQKDHLSPYKALLFLNDHLETEE